jgi:hypothetical protein
MMRKIYHTWAVDVTALVGRALSMLYMYTSGLPQTSYTFEKTILPRQRSVNMAMKLHIPLAGLVSSP